MNQQSELAHKTINANEITFHYVEAGSGPLVLFLHGFPEFWYSWRQQLQPLADAGFHVVAPDLRGYNETEKPPAVENYVVDELVTDVVRLIDALDHETARLVGHDWGGFIAWETVSQYPELVDRLVSIGVTHPITFDRGLDRLDQFRRAWYMYFFQLPSLPEWALQANDYAAQESMVAGSIVNEGAFTSADFERYREAMAKPGTLTAMVNYYRANMGKRFIRKLLLPRIGRSVTSIRFTAREISVPTMICYGEQDHFDASVMFGDVDEWVDDLRLEAFPNASHWPHLERPDRTNELLREFLDGNGDREEMA